jgi:hypothetical protein
MRKSNSKSKKLNLKKHLKEQNNLIHIKLMRNSKSMLLRLGECLARKLRKCSKKLKKEHSRVRLIQLLRYSKGLTLIQPKIRKNYLITLFFSSCPY